MSELRLRISPWLALFLGGILILWALAEKGSKVSWYDLYAGAGLVAASVILFGLLKYMERSEKLDDSASASAKDKIDR